MPTSELSNRPRVDFTFCLQPVLEIMACFLAAFEVTLGRREIGILIALQILRRASCDSISGVDATRSSGVRGDVSNAGDLDRLYAQIKSEKQNLNVLFANAGIAQYAVLGNITEELFDSIFNVNVKGCCSRYRKRYR